MYVEDMQIATNVFKYFKLHFIKIELTAECLEISVKITAHCYGAEVFDI